MYSSRKKKKSNGKYSQTNQQNKKIKKYLNSVPQYFTVKKMRKRKVKHYPLNDGIYVHTKLKYPYKSETKFSTKKFQSDNQ